MIFRFAVFPIGQACRHCCRDERGKKKKRCQFARMKPMNLSSRRQKQTRRWSHTTRITHVERGIVSLTLNTSACPAAGPKRLPLRGRFNQKLRRAKRTAPCNANPHAAPNVRRPSEPSTCTTHRFLPVTFIYTFPLSLLSCFCFTALPSFQSRTRPPSRSHFLLPKACRVLA